MVIGVGENLEGAMFGSVLVVQRDDDSDLWHSLCECNEMFLASADDLSAGRVVSCGCAEPRKHKASFPRVLTTKRSSRWKLNALCAQYPPEMFHPDQGGRAAVAEAKQVCLQCSVRVECLEWALDVGDPHGVWGALTADERRALLRKRGATPQASGYCGSCGSDEHEYVDCPAPAEAVGA